MDEGLKDSGKVVKFIQSTLRKAGYEVVRHRPNDWVRCRNVLRKVFEKREINCVIDVGANRGQYGSLLRSIGYSGQILSFEPVGANYEALAICAAAGGRWSYFRYALGAADGQAEINVGDEDVFSSFLEPTEESRLRFPGNRVARVETVQVRRLDSVLDELTIGLSSPRIYLKLDTQGFDLEVLAGATGVLDRILALQAEVSFRPIYHGMPSYLDSLREFQAHGFEVVDFLPVCRDIDGLRAIEMDCVMAKEVK